MKSWFYTAGVCVAVLMVFAALKHISIELACSGDGSGLFIEMFYSPLSLYQGPLGMRPALFELLLCAVIVTLLMLCRYPMGRMAVFVLLAAHYAGIGVHVWREVVHRTEWERVHKVWEMMPFYVVSFVVLYLCGQIAIWTVALKKWPR